MEVSALPALPDPQEEYGDGFKRCDKSAGSALSQNRKDFVERDGQVNEGVIKFYET